MLTILIIFCQLAYCASREHGGSSQTSRTDLEAWSLKEVWIRTELPNQQSEHYYRRVRLVRYDNAFCLDEVRAGTEAPHEERKVFACFKAADLYSYLEDTIYVVLQHPHRVIRMTLAKKNEAVFLENYFQTVPFDQMFTVLRRYGLELVVESNGLSDLRSAKTSDDGTLETSLTLTVLAEVERSGSGLGKRRFVISGDDPRQLYAIFNQGDYNFTRFTLDGIGLNEFEFLVEPPGDFWGKTYYFLTTTRYYDTPNLLDREMRHYASEDIIVPDRSYDTIFDDEV